MPEGWVPFNDASVIEEERRRAREAAALRGAQEHDLGTASLDEEELRRYARSLGSGSGGHSNEHTATYRQYVEDRALEATPQGKAQAEIEMALKKVAVRRVMEEAAKEKSLRPPPAMSDVASGDVPQLRGLVKRYLGDAAGGMSSGGVESHSLAEMGKTVGHIQSELEGAKALGASDGILAKLLPWAGKGLKVLGPIGAGLTAYSVGTGTAQAAERQAAGEQGSGRTVADILDSLVGPIPKDEGGDYDPLQNLRLILKQMGERQGPAMGAR